MLDKGNTKGPLCITGGTGFVGKHLIKLIEGEKHIKIKVLTRNPVHSNLPEKIEIVPGDLRDYSSLKSFIEPGAVVINLAYLKNDYLPDNLNAAHNLSMLSKEFGAAMLVHASTAVVAGRTSRDIVTEDTVCNPITEYEKTKFQIEKLFLRELDGKCPLLILRPTAIFGEGGSNLNKLVRDIFEGNRFINGIRLSIFNRRRLNLVHVENVASAIWFLINEHERVNGQCYIISDDEFKENNYADLVHMITEELALPSLRPLNIPNLSLLCPLLLRIRNRSNINPRRIYSSAKLIQTGFKKPVPFSKGIRVFLRNYRTNVSIPSASTP